MAEDTDVTQAAVRIAGEMLAAVVSDNDMLDISAETRDRVKAELAMSLYKPVMENGISLFTPEFIMQLSIGEDTEIREILNEHPELKHANEILNEFFENA